jgi:hypothetical protein
MRLAQEAVSGVRAYILEGVCHQHIARSEFLGLSRKQEANSK